MALGNNHGKEITDHKDHAMKKNNLYEKIEWKSYFQEAITKSKKTGKEVRRGVGGYFSLEAAIIVPFTFFLFILVMHLAFYYYGRCLAVQDAYCVSFRAGLLRDGEDRQHFMQSNAAWQIGEKYFGNTKPQVTFFAEDKKVRVTLQSETNREAFDLVPTDPWTYAGSAEAMDLNIPLRIRRADRIADIVRTGIRHVTGGQNGY